MSVKTEAQKHVWWLENGKLGIAKDSETDSELKYLSTDAVHTLLIHSINKDESFISADTGDPGIGMLESPSIPEEFHEALAYVAIARGYEKNPQTINNAIYFRNLFKEEISRGKQHANKDKDGTAYFIQGHDY